MKFKPGDKIKIIKKTRGQKYFSSLEKYDIFTIRLIDKNIDGNGEKCIKVYFKELIGFYYFDESDLIYAFEEEFIKEEEMMI